MQAEKPPFWRNVNVLRVVAQIVAVVVVAATLWWLINNLLTGLDRQGIPFGLGFIDDPAGFTIRDSSFDPRSPIWRLILVGVKNTLASASVGIAFAMIIGIIVGVARLSTNWIVKKLAALYVEALRNIPPLLIIIFVGSALFVNNRRLNPFTPTSPPNLFKIPGTDTNFMILSRTRLGFPSVANDGNTGLFWIIMATALVCAIGVWIWRTRVNIATGAPHHRVLWSFGTLVVLAIVVFIALQRPLRWSWPSVSESGRLIEGGLTTNDAYIALTMALALYTASHIAEIIRGSILRSPRPERGRQRARPLRLPALPVRDLATGVPDRDPLDHQPIPEPDQEHVACRRRRLSRRHAGDPDRDRQRPAGDADDPRVDDRVSHVLAVHVTRAQHRQPTVPAGGEVTS